MNIYSALKKDHDEVKELLVKLEKSPTDTESLKQLIEEITRHNQAEEEVFYKPLKKKLGKLGIMVEAGPKEHELADSMLQAYAETKMELKERKVMLSMIKKAIESHIDKEENEMFKMAHEHLTTEEANEMKQQFAKRKEEITESMKE